jgi:hypothetical protein
MSFTNDKNKKNVLKAHSSEEKKAMFTPEESFKIYEQINDNMRILRRDFKQRERKSQAAASKIVLTS